LDINIFQNTSRYLGIEFNYHFVISLNIDSENVNAHVICMPEISKILVTDLY